MTAPSPGAAPSAAARAAPAAGSGPAAAGSAAAAISPLPSAPAGAAAGAAAPAARAAGSGTSASVEGWGEPSAWSWLAAAGTGGAAARELGPAAIETENERRSTCSPLAISRPPGREASAVEGCRGHHLVLAARAADMRRAQDRALVPATGPTHVRRGGEHPLDRRVAGAALQPADRCARAARLPVAREPRPDGPESAVAIAGAAASGSASRVGSAAASRSRSILPPGVVRWSLASHPALRDAPQGRRSRRFTQHSP